MTTTIFEFSEEFKISLAKVRKIAKRHPQIFTGQTTRGDAMRHYLSKGVGVTAAQLVDLIENPGLLLELGKYAALAERELVALGNPQAAPKEVVANIMEAAKGEPEAVQILVDWLKTIIGEKPVGHAYVAVRLLLGIPEGIRKYEGPRIPRALLNARNHSEFAGWWHVEQDGNRNVTIYQKKVLDL